MNIRPNLLNPQGLLAAMVAMALSGAALADTAGRVNFVTGEVVAVKSDGSKRTLTRGDFINSGERIETNKGRVQIRFTDGSFLSLQPETVFGVDNYTFSKAQPESGSLLFNFVRGSMRTVSGAIGKVNRANYRVKTPVATIGIRGTGYSSRFVNGVLLVSVSKGMVNVANDQGNSNVSPGQTFQVRTGEAPAPAPENTTAGGRADQPQSDRSGGDDSQDNGDDGQDNQVADNTGAQGGTDNPLVAGEQTTGNGNTVLADDILGSGPVLKDTVTTTSNGNTTTAPLYSLASPMLPNLSDGGPSQTSNVSATFNATSYRGGLQNATIGGVSASSSGINAGTAQIVNVKTRIDADGDGISFGEWTNGDLGYTAFGSPSVLKLAANQFMPYIIGTTTGSMPTPGSNTYVRYTLTDATTPRVLAGSSLGGQLTQLTIGLDLSSTFLADIDMGLSLGSSAAGNLANYTTTARGVTATVSGNGLSFNNLQTTSREDSACSTSCLTSIDAFFSGTEGDTLGAAYVINGAQGSGIQGVAVLDQSASFNIRPVLDSANAYTFSSPLQRADGLFHTLNVFATFDGNYGVAQGKLLDLHEGDALLFSLGTAQAVSLYTDPQLRYSLGEYNLGTITYDAYGTQNISSPFSYVIGLSPATLPAYNAKVTYDLAASGSQASTPRFAQPSTLATSLDKLSLTLNLGEGLLDVALQASAGTGTGKTTYTASRSGYSLPTLVNGGAFQLENRELLATASGADTSCNSQAGGGCDTRLSAFLMGSAGELLGVSYAIEDIDGKGNNRLYGVAGLGQSGSTVITNNIQGLLAGDSVTPSFSGMFVSDHKTGRGDLTYEGAITAIFNQSNGSLLASQHTDNLGVTFSYGQPTAPTPMNSTDVTHYKNTLSWGRLTGTGIASFNTDGSPNSDLIMAGNSLHYIVGTPTTASLAGATTTVTYNLVGGTSPTTLNKSTLPVGSLDSGSLNINFGTGTASLAMQVSLTLNNQSPAIASMATTGTLTGSALSFANFNTTDIAKCPTASCTWQAGGFLAGSRAEMAGVGYRLTLDAQTGATPDVVSGVAAFETTTPPL